MKRRAFERLSWVLGSGVVLLLACGSSPKRFDTIDEAGSFGVAILSVEDWNSFEKVGQPSFELKAEQALNQVLPTTSLAEEQLLRTLGTLMRVALPTTKTSDVAEAVTKQDESSREGAENKTTGEAKHGLELADGGVKESASESTSETSTTTSTDASGASTTTTRTVKREKSSGDVSQVAKPGAAPAASGDAAPKGILDKELGSDAHLKYLAATALYQYVQILNRYVANAVQRTRYRPLLVTTQVTLHPSVRNAPYDAYASLMFSQASSGTYTPRLLDGGAEESSGAKDGGAPPSSERADSGDDGAPSGSKPVYVIPLLNTDNLEAQLYSGSRAEVLDVAFAILGTLGGIGVSTESSARLEKIKKSLGRNYNSLLSISRVADNTLRVRLGAQSHDGDSYAMVPRSHLVPVLLLVPCGVDTIDVMSRADFVDAERGTRLAQREPGRVHALARQVFESQGCKKLEHDEPLKAFGYALRSEMDELETLLRSKNDPACDPEHAAQFALDLLSIGVGSAYSSVDVEVPKVRPPRLPDTVRLSTLIDDGKSARLALFGAEGLSGAELSFFLEATASSSTYRFIPSAVDADARGRVLSLKFESFAPFKAELAKATWQLGGTASRPDSCGAAHTATFATTAVQYLAVPESKTKAADAQLSLKPENTVLKPDTTGKAKLGFVLTRATKGLMDPVELTASFIGGAAATGRLVSVDSVPGDYAITRGANGVVTIKPKAGAAETAVFEVAFEQLQSGSRIELALKSGSLPVSPPTVVTVQ